MVKKNNIKESKKPFSIGIIGGGQLALMLVEAAKARSLKVSVQTNNYSDPGATFADHVVKYDPLNTKGNKNLIDLCDKILFENEWIQINKLRAFGSDNTFLPSLDALAPLVDRISQKRVIKRLNLPTPRWITLSEFKKLDSKLIDNWKFPLMAKSFKGGYDGKGNKRIASITDYEFFLSQISSEEWILEEWVDYDNEFALIGSRDINGVIRLFPVVETFQNNNVCEWVLAPAEIDYEVNKFALNIFSSIVNELNYVGVLAIEFFYGNEGLLINEIAPRTHNSAHFSIEGCSSSQFDQYICITQGIKLPEIKMISNGSLMINLLGLKNDFHISIEKRIEELKNVKGLNLHWYGKNKEVKGRKMGHVTFLLNEKNHLSRLKKAKEFLSKVRLIWPAPNN